MLNIIAGIIPGLIWTLLFIIIDRKKCKRKYKELILLFIIGGIGSYFCYRLEMHFGSYFKKTKDSNYLEILFYAICGVAIFEESYKWLLIIIETLREKKKESYDILYNSIFTSIGFATIENVLYYAIPYGYLNALNRLTTAVLSHTLTAIWMGYFLEKSFQKEKVQKIIYLGLSIITPTLLHALYNSFLYGNGKYKAYFPYYYIVFIMTSIILCIIIIKQRKEEKNEIRNSNTRKTCN